MSFRMVIELPDREGAQAVVQTLDAYKLRLRAGIELTKRRLAAFEARYGVDTGHFLHEMTAEDLTGGDLEYVEWAGEARLLEGLEAELHELAHARYQLPCIRSEHRTCLGYPGGDRRSRAHFSSG